VTEAECVEPCACSVCQQLMSATAKGECPATFTAAESIDQIDLVGNGHPGGSSRPTAPN